MRKTISGLSVSGFGITDLVTHKTLIALAPLRSVVQHDAGSIILCKDLMFEKKFNRLLCRRSTHFFAITTRVENDSEKTSIDFFVVTQHIFLMPLWRTTT